MRILAGNLPQEEFSAEQIDVIAKEVFEWCDGHPYLTQRLLELIDENEAFRNADIDQLPGMIGDLVRQEILYQNDPNLAYTFDYLWRNQDYRDRVHLIFQTENTEKPRKTIQNEEDLLAVGIIKRSAESYLIIRNNIYREALSNLIQDEAELFRHNDGQGG